MEEKPSERNSISVCDILKNNTTKVIKKLESQIPTSIQGYSDMYGQYLHLLDDYFGTCYLWQKQYFDKFGMDSKTLIAINSYWDAITDLYCTQIDIIASSQKSSVDMRSNLIKLCDQYIHETMDYYGRIFSRAMSEIKES